MNFTGQHRCNLESTYQESLVGLIVECTGEYYNLDKGISPTINDSIPKVKLTTNENSKAILGVISCEEDDENKRTFGGNFVSIYQNTDGIKRTFINSLGEGGVWVCSSNGNLEIGDTITSSNIAGYGMKQSDDLMHNYTVAKATMNCNFSTIEADSHILKRRPKVNIIVSEYERQITEEVVEECIKIVKENGKYVKKISSKTYTRDVSEEVDIYDENNQLIGREVIPKVEILQTTKEEIVKDSSGNIIWENITNEQGSTVYEDIYQIRYLKSDGTILNKSQYDAIIASSGQAYKAVFVGCTYHSG
jgi:energy-coupling factor transporter ATP-binding protein EcfA2